MCGLVGFSGSSNYDVRTLQTLMILNAIDRGQDATGFYNPEQGLVKKAEHAKKFFPLNKLKRSNLFIGHVRAKTVGTNIDKNAHPFEYDNVVLAHNGTLSNHFSILANYGLSSANFDVDSQCLAGMLNVSMSKSDYAFTDALEYFKPLTEFVGAAALLFKDKRDYANGRDSRLFVYRNTERPLTYTHDEFGNMYISSIEDPLLTCEFSKVTEFEPHKVYEIEDGEIIAEYDIPEYVPANKGISAQSIAKMFASLTGGLFSVNFYELPKNWIQFALTEEVAKKYKLDSLVKDKFYFVEDIDYDKGFNDNTVAPTHVKIYGPNKKLMSVPIFAFNVEHINYGITNYVKILTDCVNSSNKSISIAKAGDILPIRQVIYKTKQNPTLAVSCISVLDNNNLYDLPSSFCRPLTLAEEKLYLESKKQAEKEAKKAATKTKVVQTRVKPKKVSEEVEILNKNIEQDFQLLFEDALEVSPELGTISVPMDIYIKNLQEIKNKIDEMSLNLLDKFKKHKMKEFNNIYSYSDFNRSLQSMYSTLNEVSAIKEYSPDNQ